MKKLVLFFGYSILFVLYLTVIGLWISIPEELTLNISTSLFTITLSCLILIYDRQRFARYYLSGHFKKLSTALLSIFLLASVLAMINYLAFKNPYVLDLSALRLNSLTEKSTQIVQSMKGDISFKVFALKRDQAAALSLIELYRHANNKVNVEAIDVEVRPDLVAKYSIVKAPTIVIEYNGRHEYIGHYEELSLTNALIKLSRASSPVIYFTTGHGEPALSDHSNNGMSEFEALLLNSSFNLKSLELARLDKLPADLSALAIIGPQSAFLPKEIALLDQYINSGGKLLIALDPQMSKDPLLSLRQLLLRHKMTISNDMVVDTLNHVSGSNGTVPLVKQLNKDHLISKEISSYVFFPLASSVEANENFSGRFYTLAESTPFPASWAESDFSQVVKGQIHFDQGFDKKGPSALAMAFESLGKDAKLSRLVLMGNSGLIKNQYAKFVGNAQLVANALSWLSLDGQIDSFNLPFGENEPVFISGTQIGTIFYTVVILLPLLLFSLAIVIYRRNRS